MKALKAVSPFFIIHGLLRIADAAPAVNPESDLLLMLNTTASIVNFQPLSPVQLSYPNGSYITLGEDQPEDFQCIIQYKPRGVDLYDIDALVNFVTAFSELALRQWNEIQESFLHDFASLRLRFASTRAPGQRKLATKEIIWSIRIISAFLHREKRGYAELSAQPEYQGSPQLGFAQLVKLAAPSPKTPNVAASNVTLAQRADMEDNSHSDEGVIQLPDSVTSGASNAAAEIVDLKVSQNGKTFDPYTIYSILMNLLLVEAQEDYKEEGTLGLRGLDVDREWQVTIQALTPTSIDDLTHRIIIEAIADLAQSLATVLPAQFRWKECVFNIRDNGRMVGRGVIKHKDT